MSTRNGAALRSVTRRGGLALLALAVAWAMMPAPGQAQATDTYQVRTEDVPAYWGSQLDFDASSPTIAWPGTGLPTHKTLTNVTWSSTNHDKVPAIKPGDDGGTWSNLLTETFKNVGSYDGRKIDAKVTFKKVSVGKHYSTTTHNSDNYMALSYVAGRTLFLGSSSASGTNAHPWRAAKTWQMSVDLTWSDTGAACKIPFLLDVRDIDQVNAYNSGTNKKPSWVTRWRESFSCDRTKYDRWVFPANKLTPTSLADKKKNDTFSCPDGSDHGGLDVGGSAALTEAGLYVVSTTGNFTFTYKGGNSLMKVNIYPASKSQANPGAPRKGALLTD